MSATIVASALRSLRYPSARNVEAGMRRSLRMLLLLRKVELLPRSGLTWSFSPLPYGWLLLSKVLL